jgi:uncharacterized membrane protein YedE/YeeE
LAAGVGLGLTLMGMFLFTGHGLGASGFFTNGGLAGSLIAGRFRFKIERGPHTSAGARMGFAVGGGILSGFGASLAGGCTSSLGLSGGAVLAVASFVFLIAFFAAGLLVAALAGRIWQ